MQNSYIIDTFLSGLAWMTVIYLYFDTRARIATLNNLISVHALKVALPAMLKRSTFIAAPLMTFYLFLLWRFYGLMVYSTSWGAGGAGLLAGMAMTAIPLMWLNVMLVCVKNSRYATHIKPDVPAGSQ
ncbi:hypothetical protein [Psychrobacter sp. W2-37-MNA-CIBAN-0211]|uniref:hypothetical protein n=1 Tax=Psychrobacter sp. W2-37-MNA-CIBAN-0211 TaxID=3140443 RepID=UPI003322264A